MNKDEKIKQLRERTKAKRKTYLKYKKEIGDAQENGSGGQRSEAQIEMDKLNQKKALNKGYAWACKRAFADPLNRILDQIERDSKGGL